jgi:hypothetical protein
LFFLENMGFIVTSVNLVIFRTASLHLCRMCSLAVAMIWSFARQ